MKRDSYSVPFEHSDLDWQAWEGEYGYNKDGVFGQDPTVIPKDGMCCGRLTDNFSYWKGANPTLKIQDFLYHVPGGCSYSDYSGSTVDRANLVVMLEQFGDKPGVESIFGSHGYKGIAIRHDILCEDASPCLAKCADPDHEPGLPCDCDRCEECESCVSQSTRGEIRSALREIERSGYLDDSAISDIENELIDEAWTDWAKREFLEEIRKRGIQVTDEQAEDDRLIRSVFYETEPDWIFESATSAHIDMGQVAKLVKQEDFSDR